ncbi:retinoic acid receptor responder protein 3-like [Myotis lucifugus]|uniref:retinoic acid receptor responder protein 3-like n=1 Tax=Myotis lucifugus TaxID=59463 RepID=UPI0003C439A0|nr:retinoic acid receptor responder protein 3-like [Myotis lucifugus]
MCQQSLLGDCEPCPQGRKLGNNRRAFSNAQIRVEPKPGDLIEIPRIGSSHWALYLGDGYVIHLAPPGENSEAGTPTGSGVVKRQLLVEVLGNCFYKVNNHLDHLYKPRPIKEMISAGKEMVGMEMEYSFLSRNYEHFVRDLRYGKARSRQLCHHLPLQR